MKLISSPSLFCLLLIPSLVVSPILAQSSPAGLTSPAGAVVPQVAPVDNTDLQVRVVESAGPDAKANSISAKDLAIAVTNGVGAPVADAAVAVRLPDSGPSGAFADGSHAAVGYTDGKGLARFNGLHWGTTPGSVPMRVTATKGSSHAALVLNENITSDVTTVVQVPAPAPQPLATAQTAPSTQPVSTASQHLPQPGQTGATQPATQPRATPLVVTPAPPATTLSQPAKVEPTVSVTGASPTASEHSGKTKWIILAAVVAAAAGAGVAVMGKGKSTASAPTSTGLSIGTPSVSVGQP